MTRDGAEIRRTRWLDAAREIARNLIENAVWLGEVCAFHGATSPEAVGAPPRFRSFGGDLYEGSAGIARFLALASMALEGPQIRETALGAIRHALSSGEGWSLFGGEMGIGLAALEIAERLDAPALVAPAVQTIERASQVALVEGGSYDFLIGQAGVVWGLAAAIDYDLDGGWRERALTLASALLKRGEQPPSSVASGSALSFPMSDGAPEHLCGLAHGASGFALAFEAAQGLDPPEQKWAAAARAARLFERAYYSADFGSWADLRSAGNGEEPVGVTYPHMWCHGSIGITAERIVAGRGDPLSRVDAVGGLAGAKAHAKSLLSGPVGAPGGDAVNGSLCHGLAGLIDLFIDAGLASEEDSWFALAADLGDLMINDSRRPEGFRSGVPGGWPAPGLMLGTAGMGWSLMRLAEPIPTPSGWRPGPARQALDQNGELHAAKHQAAPAVSEPD